MDTPLKVLIAEDEQLIVFTLRGQLEAQGCQIVASAKNGEEALAQCREHNPDVVLMDIRMPVMSGIEATKRIMAEHPTCIVMLTAHGQGDHVTEAQDAGAMAYLVKPVSGDQILPAIELARRRFEEFLSLRRDVANLQDTLQTRKLIDRAKGILMDRAGLSEADAFRRLQKLAMDRRMTMKAVAERVLETAKESDGFFGATPAACK